MAGKSTRGVAIAIAVAVAAAVIVAIAAVYMGGDRSDAPAPQPSGPSELGPETVLAPRSDASVVSLDSQSAALNGAVVQPQQAQGTTDAADPTRFESEYLVFTTSLPEAAPDDKVIAFLRRDAARYLSRMRINAEADHERRKRENASTQPWSVDIVWTQTAQAGDIVSLLGEASEYTGGAHPVSFFDTHIANRNTGEAIAFEDMLLPTRSPSPALQIAICEALKAAKLARGGTATIYDEPVACVGPGANIKPEQAMIALAPSDVADRFGGLYVYYAPYVVGPYAEGSYGLTIQQGVFAEDLRPEARALFAGTAPTLRD
jgi:hypothetical protein